MKVDIKSGLKYLGGVFTDHRSEIFTGIGIGGMFAMTIMSVKVTPTAIEMINERECVEHVDHLPKKEIVKTVWKLYIPPAIIGMVSTACLIGATVDNKRRNAALATAYSIAERSLREYRDAIHEIGPKKEQEIKEAIVKKRASETCPSESTIIETGRGNVLFKDPITNQLFRSSTDAVRKVENDLNRRMRDEMFISLDDFYDELGLPHMGNGVGDKLGWSIDTGYIQITLTPQLTEDDTICVFIEHDVPPNYPR